MTAAPKPDWLTIRPPEPNAYRRTQTLLGCGGLQTVCAQARCPNQSECWTHGDATFLLLGRTCTRHCQFCAIDTDAAPPQPDPQEPEKTAHAVQAMGLKHAVLTVVCRDDLPDGGAAHIAATIQAIHRRTPNVNVEVLTGDFQGDPNALQTVLDAQPDVLGHNLETVARLTPQVRDPRASYPASLEFLHRAHRLQPGLVTKSSLMLGLGETDLEVQQTLEDLRQAGVSLLTLGQYLQPSPRHAPVQRWVTPKEFDLWNLRAQALGFYPACGPLVRSSYRAGELFLKAQRV